MVVGDMETETGLLVIGAGPAGYLAAIRAAQHGLDVTLVDRRASLGGVCLNEGCIPSKAVIHASDLFHEAGNSADIGISAEPELDMDTLQEWRQQVVDKLTSGVKMLEERYGVTVVKGDAYLKGPGEAHVDGSDGSETVSFDDCIVATGSSIVEIPGIDIDGETVITSAEALELDEVPDRMVVIGGGYIGMELGMVYQKLGSDVTVVEAGERILPHLPADLVTPVETRAEDLGMDIRAGTTADDVAVADGTATVTLGDETVEADAVLVAVGREPNTDDVGLENTGAELDDDGFVETDEQMKAAEGIYAVGDIAGEPMLAHKGYQEGAVAAGAIAGESTAADFVVPAVIYTDPEVATVGMSRAEAEDSGFEVSVGKFAFGASGRAATLARDDGFVRVVTDAESGALLGAEMVGPRVSELVAEATLALEMGAVVEDIAATVHAHPTLSEAFKEACEDAVGRAIHKYNPPRD